MREEGNGFYLELLELLKHDSAARFYAENGDLLRNKVYECAMNMDKDLIKLLLSNEKIKNKFFTDIDGLLVFDKTAFGWAINNKAFLKDSYTRFKNTIGLIDSNEQFISSKNDVVLSFPYKDCVLEGGQTKEDQKRDEIYYNELLAPDDVDRLLAPKVLTNAKKYTKDGEELISSFSDEDNLLIKGNNLLALSSILKRYENKVKCIYIDPPYNIGGDSFKYNDNFNHSTWLTFMKNRLKNAKKLLSDNGCIYVHIDYHEIAYLMVLMDEIFGKENFIQIISIKTATPAGFKVVNPGPVNVTEFVLMYTKNKKNYNFKKGYVKAGYQSDYKYYVENINDNPEKWEISSIRDVVLGQFEKNIENELKEKFGKDIANSIINTEIEKFAMKNSDKIFATYGPHKPSGILKELIKISKENPENIIFKERENNEPFILKNGRLFAFYSKKLKEIDGKKCSTQLLTDFWNDLSWDTLSDEGGVTLKNGKKPEKLLKRIIELSTEKNDIVLDFHLGSGTTCAVAHKMDRQYIGIEQLNYGENDSIVRLNNVINGDSSGISKDADINWQGGGSFVYCELKELNQKYINEVIIANDKKLTELYSDIKSSEFISYRVDIDELEKSAKSFEELQTHEKKDLLIKILDKNMLYVNYSDIDDNDFEITEREKAFTKSFYGDA